MLYVVLILSNHIYELAEESRLKLKEILKEPLENGAVCVSPDMWSDNHRMIKVEQIY